MKTHPEKRLKPLKYVKNSVVLKNNRCLRNQKRHSVVYIVCINRQTHTNNGTE